MRLLLLPMVLSVSNCERDNSEDQLGPTASAKEAEMLNCTKVEYKGRIRKLCPPLDPLESTGERELVKNIPKELGEKCREIMHENRNQPDNTEIPFEFDGENYVAVIVKRDKTFGGQRTELSLYKLVQEEDVGPDH